ncbi:MAG: hypothetical protein IT440_03105 [Phycisphaeraceae bacterium]|nr:hypothetical protein [Phycisphaeraceae bacterium]
MDEKTRSRLIQDHLESIRQLQAEAAVEAGGKTMTWPPRGYYWVFQTVAGLTLGGLGAMVSLGVNILGALIVGVPPLKLIQVYLTFPMGQRALELGPHEAGAAYFVGCLLYLVTGGLYGIGFHLFMTWYYDDANFSKRFIVGSVVGLGIWFVNFYLVLSWLQPALLGGNWIVREVPIWIGAGTHLVFAWTMVLVQNWSAFDPRSR